MLSCQTDVTCFVNILCRFIEIKDIFSTLSDTYSWITNMSLMQIWIGSLLMQFSLVTYINYKSRGIKT